MSEHDLAARRIDQPSAFKVGLIGQRGRDLIQIEAAQVQHAARIARRTDPVKQRRQRQMRAVVSNAGEEPIGQWRRGDSRAHRVVR